MPAQVIRLFDTERSPSIIDEISPFVEAGFAIHWLHPRQKRPIGKDWSTAPVAVLADLQRSYAADNNVGVRLGEFSRAAGLYVHVLDLDVRVDNLADEVWDTLRNLFPDVDFDALPMVRSGSGGASCHLYFCSTRPFYSKKLATSPGKHRGDDGKWHRDWEIELYGTGKQVVLPPSIHPISGNPYRWERPFDFVMLDLGLVPEIDASAIDAIGAATDETYAFEERAPLDFKPGQLERELELIEISDLDYDDWVRLGQALHHQFGGSQEGFDLWLEHTKRSTKFTGDAQIREMRRIKWPSFGRYRGKPVTMATIRTWAMEARAAALRDAFDEEDDEAVSAADNDPADFDDLFGGDDGDGDKPVSGGGVDQFDDDTPSASPESDPESAGTLDWQSLLHWNNEEPPALKSTLHNTRLIVENDIWTRGVMAFNEFTQEVVQRGRPGIKKAKRKKQAKPVLQLTGENWHVRDQINGDFWTEDKDNAIRGLLEAPTTQGGYGIKFSDRDLRAAIDIAARKNGFHPVREYLSLLVWDGTPRVETLFIDYLNTPDDNYHRSVARLTLVAAVTRAFEPGHKFDFATILEGSQGKRKSTFIRTLAKNWFAELDGDFSDPKSLVEQMQGSWILEIPELSSFARSDVRAIKAFMSRQEDKVRLAYARRAQSFPRQCIFIGSTNDDKYLKDDTGARRYWPVRTSIDVAIDTERLLREIDQLWAEAVVMYRQMRSEKPHGTLPLYLTDPEARATAARLQESRRVETADDALAGQIAEWLERPINHGGFEDEDDDSNPVNRNETCLLEIWCECLGRDRGLYTQVHAQMLGRSMSQVAGWVAQGSLYSHPKYGRQRLYERGGIAGRLERLDGKAA